MISTAPVLVKDIKVLIGQVHVTRPPHRLQTVLGSCIGLVIYDPQIRLAGMAHVLLPNSDGRPPGLLPGKYGDHAVRCLITSLLAHGASRTRLMSKLAGGARMFEHTLENSRDIGASNILAVIKSLKDSGIPIAASHLGGCLGRRAEFTPEDLSYQIEDFGQNIVTI
jgi:chemotaxis protein CheD